MARRLLLTKKQIESRLAEVPGWVQSGKAIVRKWEFKNFPHALAFIERVADLAEEMNHHPDIYNSWNKVRLRLTTHDRGGLTDLDFDLAAKINRLSPH